MLFLVVMFVHSIYFGFLVNLSYFLNSCFCLESYLKTTLNFQKDFFLKFELIKTLRIGNGHTFSQNSKRKVKYNEFKHAFILGKLLASAMCIIE